MFPMVASIEVSDADLYHMELLRYSCVYVLQYYIMTCYSWRLTLALASSRWSLMHSNTLHHFTCWHWLSLEPQVERGSILHGHFVTSIENRLLEDQVHWWLLVHHNKCYIPFREYLFELFFRKNNVRIYQNVDKWLIVLDFNILACFPVSVTLFHTNYHLSWIRNS